MWQSSFWPLNLLRPVPRPFRLSQPSPKRRPQPASLRVPTAPTGAAGTWQSSFSPLHLLRPSPTRPPHHASLRIAAGRPRKDQWAEPTSRLAAPTQLSNATADSPGPSTATPSFPRTRESRGLESDRAARRRCSSAPASAAPCASSPSTHHGNPRQSPASLLNMLQQAGTRDCAHAFLFIRPQRAAQRTYFVKPSFPSTSIVSLLITRYDGSSTILVLGRYVPGSKQPPGPQKDTEYRSPAGAIAKPNGSAHVECFQKPASGCVGLATAVFSTTRSVSEFPHADRANINTGTIEARILEIRFICETSNG